MTLGSGAEGRYATPDATLSHCMEGAQPAGDTTLGWERLEGLRDGRQEGDPSSTGMSVKMPGEFGAQGRLDHHQPWMPCQKTETWLKLS